MIKKRFPSKKQKKGQALLEYALIIGMGAILALGFATTFNTFIKEGILGFNSVLEQDLRTGSADTYDPVRIWEN